MGLLITGLVVFLGVHLLRVLSEEQRTRLIQTYGALAFKGAYSIVSVVGFILIVAGYAAARTDPVMLYTPPTGMAHAASLFTLVAFVLLVAAYIPGNWFDAIDAFWRASILKEYFGKEFVDTYCTLKEVEADRFYAEPTARDFEWYLRTV